MENKNDKEKIMNFANELESVLRPLTEKAMELGLVSPDASMKALQIPTAEVKNVVAEIQPTPQMPDEKKRLVKMLMDFLEMVIDRAAITEIDMNDRQIICNVSSVLANLVK